MDSSCTATKHLTDCSQRMVMRPPHLPGSAHCVWRDGVHVCVVGRQIRRLTSPPRLQHTAAERTVERRGVRGVEWRSGVEWSSVEWSSVEWSGVEWSTVSRVESFAFNFISFEDGATTVGTDQGTYLWTKENGMQRRAIAD
jgi:hypothetical protein